MTDLSAGYSSGTDEQFRASCLEDLARWVRDTPRAAAVLAPDREPLPFPGLHTKAAAVACRLQAAGVRPGDVVAVAMPQGADLLPALLGALEAAAVAPLDWHLTEAEFHSQLALIRPSALLTGCAGQSHAAAGAQAASVPVIEIDTAPGGPHLEICEDRRSVARDCALILQTSATTGASKLVPLTHRNLRAICAGARRGLRFDQNDRYLSVMPLHHILGFSCALAQLMTGGSVACTGFDPKRFGAWLDEMSPTWYAAGPVLHQAILDLAKKDPGPFQRAPLRFVRCGSGACSPTLLSELERVLQVQVINGYGLTEAGPVTNTQPDSPAKLGSVGRTIGPEIAVMDASGNLLPANAEGEVILGGDAVMAGYLDDPDANREVFRGGWFRTGDLGRLDEDGDLFITGRLKEIINRGGETIAPLEIDHALAEHPSVAHAASFAVAHPTLGEDIAAAVVLRPGANLPAAAIRAFLGTRLSRAKVPSRIWFVESIPVSASGKPLRGALSAAFPAHAQTEEPSEVRAGGGADLSPAVRRGIAEIWMSVLNTRSSDAEQNFFGLGGDSLSAARMFALLEQEFQVAMGFSDHMNFFDSPTLSQLERLVAYCTSKTRPSATAFKEVQFEDVSAVEVQVNGAGPPIFFFPGESVDPSYQRHLVRHLGGTQPFFVLRHRLTDPTEFDAIAGRFAALITSIRPQGSLVLAGHCYGGILAYEVSQRLTVRRPAEIAVILVDVNTPGYPKTKAGSYLRYLPAAIGALFRDRGNTLAAEIREHFRFVRALRSANRGAKLRLTAANPVPLDVPPGPVLTPAGVVLRTYAPRPFQGRLANAVAGGSQVSSRVLEDPRLGWRDFALGPFHQCSVAGRHDSIFDHENVPDLARFIRSVLRAIQLEPQREESLAHAPADLHSRP